MSVGEGEVTSEGDHNVVSSVGISEPVDVVKELLSLFGSIVGIKIWVRYSRIVVVKSLINRKTIGPAVVILHDSSEKLFLLSKMLGEGPPQVV